MKILLPKTVRSILTSVVLICSSITQADVKSEQVARDCPNPQMTEKLCVKYLRGYLDALRQLNHTSLKPKRSSFEERAYRTRLGNTNSTNPVKEQLGICLPNQINDQELKQILASSSGTELSPELAVLKAIKAKYPC